jgi:hypothetical protein
MFIISFPKPNIIGYIGGYGDRIVGLISILTISNVLGKSFKISWEKEDINKIFEMNDYFIDNIPNNSLLVNIIDNQHLIKDFLIGSEDFFKDNNIVFYCNQEISQYIFKNKSLKGYSETEYQNLDYFKMILSNYQKLYTEILVFRPEIKQEINELVSPYKDNIIIGIQIRTGDIYILNNNGVNPYCLLNNLEKDIKEILNEIKNKIKYENYYVFITSDYNDILSLAKGVWLEERIIYNNKPSYHLDRRINDSDFSKIFVDNYILSQIVNELYITPESNYGRIAYLSSPLDNCFDLKCNKLNKKNMLSKHDNIWLV